MANKYRNEVEVNLDGGKYTLRPTFNALAEIEDHFNTSLFKVIEMVTRGELRLKDAFFILECGIKASGSTFERDQLEYHISQAGNNNVLIAIGTFLTAATLSGDSIKKN